MSGSVRDRMSGTNSDERVGRGTTTDFLGMKSADGFVTIINKRQGRTYTWVAQCSKPGCFCSGITFSHEYLVNGGVIKCAASGHDSASIEPTSARHPSDAGVQQRMRADVVLSPRQRMQDRQRQEELDALGGEQHAEN